MHRAKLTTQRHLFSIPDTVCYLNAAYLSPLPNTAAAEGAKGMARKARPWEITVPDFFTDVERLRSLFAQLINADPSCVSLNNAASYGAATAALNSKVSPGQSIVTLGQEHTSNRFVWQSIAAQQQAELRVVRPQPSETWTDAVIEQIDESTAVVAVVHTHWADGNVLDLQRIGQRCRHIGAMFVVDGTQSVGAVPLDATALQPDFLFVAGYKWMLCPYGVSFLYAHPKYHDNGITLEQHGWDELGSDRSAATFGVPGSELMDGTLKDEHSASARRFDGGERANFATLPAAIASVEQLLEWGVAEVGAGIEPLTKAVAFGAKERGLVTPVVHAPHLIGITRPDGEWPEELVADLWNKHSVHVSMRGRNLRVSPHVYNDLRDVNRLFTALDACLIK